MEALLALWFICGIVCAVIANSKGRSALGWFLVGLLIGFFGVILVAVLPSEEKAPPGLRAVKCPRCNAAQNVPNCSQYECWQCKTEISAGMPNTVSASAASPGAISVTPKPLRQGMTKRTIRCPLCNAEQKIPTGAKRYTCGRCGEINQSPRS